MERFVGCVGFPSPIGAIGESSGAVQHSGPESHSLEVGQLLSTQGLVANFSDYQWLRYRGSSIVFIQLGDFGADAGPTRVRWLEEVEIGNRLVLQRRIERRRAFMNRNRMVVWIR